MADPKSFLIEYATGSIPPPYNYAYRLEGRFEGEEVLVIYVLTYRYRNGLASSRLASSGYSDSDDLSWTGRLHGGPVTQWRTLLTEARLIAPEIAPAPGSDSFVVTVVDSGGAERHGAPQTRDPWKPLITAIDQQARAETHHPRAHP
jgi:hypothetical protein